MSKRRNKTNNYDKEQIELLSQMLDKTGNPLDLEDIMPKKLGKGMSLKGGTIPPMSVKSVLTRLSKPSATRLSKPSAKTKRFKDGGLIAAIEKVKAKKMETGGDPSIGEKINFPGMNKDKNKDKKVPLKFKGFSMLPESVQKKINPELAKKYEKGGVVRGMGKAYQGKPRPVKIR